MDREIAPAVRQRALIRKIATAVAVAAIVIVAFIVIVGWLSPSIRQRDVQTAVVERGDVEAVVQASGVIVPDIEQVVSSPVEARVLRIDRRAGERVKAGDTLLTLDTLATRLELERVQEGLARKNSETSQLQLENEEEIASLLAQLEQQKLDAEIVRLTAEQQNRLRAEGLTSEQLALAATTAAKKSAIEIAQLEQKIARARRSAAAKIDAARLDVSIMRKGLEESQRQLDLSMMRADRDGVITWIVPEQGATVRRGDVLARIADFSTFRVAATVSDMYVPRLAPGMPVRVKVDGRVVNGTLASIDPRIENGVAKLNVTLDRASQAGLVNNVRADVLIVTGTKRGVLRVKKGALQPSGNESVFLVRGDRLVRVPVSFGLAGDDQIEIRTGVSAGQTVVISNMNDYEGLKEMRLK
jgi:HlyD family secretion protein